MNKAQKYIVIGLIAAIVTVVAELLQGWVPSTDISDKMSILFSSIENMSVWRIGLGSTIGAIGILLQYYGMQAIYLTFDNKDSRSAKIYSIGLYGFSFLGAIIHVLMSMLMYVYKVNVGNSDQLAIVTDFTLWFVVPLLVLFFALYIPFAVVMFVQIWQGHSILPRWVAWLNPLCGKFFFGMITGLLPSSAMVNGISNANMGLSSLILFTVVLMYIKDK